MHEELWELSTSYLSVFTITVSHFQYRPHGVNMDTSTPLHHTTNIFLTYSDILELSRLFSFSLWSVNCKIISARINKPTIYIMSAELLQH